MRVRRPAALLLWLAMLSCSAGAFAQAPAEAGDVEAGRGHFDRGVEYVEDGDLHGALIEFKRAYAASPNYRVLYNLGQVCNELREYVDAQRYLQMYLTQGAGEIDPARKRDVESMLSKLSSRIATLVLASNEAGAELYVDDVDVGKTPLSEPVRVSTGTRIVSAAMSGRPRVTRVVEAAGGETQVVRLDFPPPGDNSAVSRATPATRANEGGSSAAVVWLGIGTGALAVGAGVLGYLAARDASDYHDAVHRKTTPRELDDLDNRATTKALVTDILIGATAVAGAVTLIVALQGSGKPDTAPRSDHARAQLDLGPGALRFHGQF